MIDASGFLKRLARKRDAKAREKPAPAKPLSHIHSILERLATYRDELDTTFRQPVPYN